MDIFTVKPLDQEDLEEALMEAQLKVVLEAQDQTAKAAEAAEPEPMAREAVAEAQEESY